MSNTVSAQQSEIDSLKQIISITKDDTANIKSLLTLGDKFEFSSPDTALHYYEKALIISERINAKKLIAKCYKYIGIAHLYLGNYSKSLEHFNKTLAINIEIDDKYQTSSSYGNIGIIYMYQGEFSKTIEYYHKQLELVEELGKKQAMGRCFNNIGLVYSQQGIFAKALDNFNKSLKIAEELGNNKEIATCLGNIGIIHWEEKNFDGAITAYENQLKINQELGINKGIASSYNNIGLTHKSSGNLSKALEYYYKSLKISESLKDQNTISTNYTNIGLLHIAQADNSTTEEERLISLDSTIYFTKKALIINNEIEVQSKLEYSTLSKAWWAAGSTTDAADNFNKLIDLNNKNILVNFSFLSELEKESFFKTVKSDYWNFNSFALCYQNEDPSITETVFNNTVKNKGLILKSNTAMKNAIHSSQDTVLINTYEEWISLKKQIAKKYSRGQNTKELESTANDLESLLVKTSQEFSDFNKVQNISWRDVQASLKKGEAAIEFLHFPLLNPDTSIVTYTKTVQYVALIVKPNSKTPEMIPLFEEKQLEEVIGEFGGNNYDYINRIYGRNKAINKQLYELIWAPMEKSLKGSKQIFLSPDGLLHKISFPAIAKEQDVYLCDAYQVDVKSSTGKITEENGQNLNMSTASLFGGIMYDTDSTKSKIWNYLVATKAETEKIEHILKQSEVKVKSYSNVSATEEEFKISASNSNILHIATHGFFYPEPVEGHKSMNMKIESRDIVFRGGNRGFGVKSFVENTNPLMRSGLVFAGANDVWSKKNKNETSEDGVLTAQEVANLDMRNTELVVLSACETGLGDIKGSEGVYGLQRTFKMAGVDYIIMSLWQVPDNETEEFMTLFYEKLVTQNDIKKAFTLTQHEMREKYDPYFWAAFVLIE